ncbi:MAG: hypothetical protein JWM25_1874 [Thermoleophilia bacterium]|nr:hypothetical protein [Thermoleophilia bacterium]
MPGMTRIGICDDKDFYRRALGLCLNGQRGIEVVGEATNGREAIALVTEHRPDVLLLDVSMPIMDGIEALPHVRAASPSTHVVMLSGFADAATKARALAAGAFSFIEKGSTMLEIEAAIADAQEARA